MKTSTCINENYFWLNGDDEYFSNAPLNCDIDCDVVIVGGGLTGLSSAYHIKKHDPSLSVVLLESRIMGMGSSGRNSAFVVPVLGFNLNFLRLVLDREQLKAYVDHSYRAIGYLTNFIESESIQCDLKKNGLLEVAHTSFQMKIAHSEAKLFRELGCDKFEFLDSNSIKKYIDNPMYIGGRREPAVCTLDPGKLVREEKKLVESLGVKVYENTSVSTYRAGRTVELVTPGGRVNASKAVMATNAYSGNLKIRKNRFIPVFSYIVLTEPLSPAQIAELGWPGREAILEKRAGIHYLRLTADNRLLVGGHDYFYYMGDSLDSLFGHESQPRTFARLESYMHRVFPSLKDIKITHRWGGPFSVTLNLLPNIGYLSDEKNIVSAFGYSGSGIAQSFNSGQILRDLLFQPNSEFMKLPFVNAKSPYAFSGPLRYLVVNGALKIINLYDWLTDN